MKHQILKKTPSSEIVKIVTDSGDTYYNGGLVSRDSLELLKYQGKLNPTKKLESLANLLDGSVDVSLVPQLMSVIVPTTSESVEGYKYFVTSIINNYLTIILDLVSGISELRCYDDSDQEVLRLEFDDPSLNRIITITSNPGSTEISNIDLTTYLLQSDPDPLRNKSKYHLRNDLFKSTRDEINNISQFGSLLIDNCCGNILGTTRISRDDDEDDESEPDISWDPLIFYSVGDQVEFKDKTWQATKGGINQIPGFSQQWSLLDYTPESSLKYYRISVVLENGEADVKINGVNSSNSYIKPSTEVTITITSSFGYAVDEVKLNNEIRTLSNSAITINSLDRDSVLKVLLSSEGLDQIEPDIIINDQSFKVSELPEGIEVWIDYKTGESVRLESDYIRVKAGTWTKIYCKNNNPEYYLIDGYSEFTSSSESYNLKLSNREYLIRVIASNNTQTSVETIKYNDNTIEDTQIKFRLNYGYTLSKVIINGTELSDDLINKPNRGKLYHDFTLLKAEICEITNIEIITNEN